LRFTLIAILVAGCLFGIGYYPAVKYDSPDGPISLIFGLSLALFLMIPGYLVVRWGLGKSQKIFLIAFGAGFLIRLVLLVTLIILYSKLIREKDFCFALAFGTCYLALSGLEVLSFRSAVFQNKNEGSSPSGE
jgi:hypothetical protein